MLHVIERQHRVEQHEPGVVADRRGASPARAAVGLEPRRGVVAEVADGAAGEARQPGHERRLKAVHQLAQRVDERLLGVGGHAGALDHGLAVAAAQDQERILAEERVAPDVLAALDALEQERVVGMLGDLEERRHRRQQVGHELLHHRHERGPLGQVHELFERRLLHCRSSVLSAMSGVIVARRASAASRITRSAGRWPVHHSNCACAWATSMSSPPIVRQPARAASRAIALRRVVDQVVDETAAVKAIVVRQRRRVGVGRGADRRGIDEQIPATPGRAATATPRRRSTPPPTAPARHAARQS